MTQQASTPDALRLADRLDANMGDTRKPAAAELRRQHAEIERLRADAARYRKWRADYTSDGATDMLIALADAWEPDQVDSAIDAAMRDAP